MSVCSQMGNGQSKGGKKKKKDPVKEGTGLDDDFPSGPQEMENDELQQEGSKLFEKDRSRRRDVLKDLVSLNQSGTYSHEGGGGHLHASSQNDERNISDDNYAPSNEVKQGDAQSTVQAGKDPIGVFGDSSLANGHVTGNSSGKNCGESVLIGRGLSPSNHPSLTPGTDAPGVTPRDVVDTTSERGPVDVPNSVHGNAPGDVPSIVPGGSTQGTADDALVGAFANVTIDGPGSVPGSAPRGAPCDVPDSAPGGAPCGIRSDFPGNNPANAPIEPSGIISVRVSSGLFHNPPPSCPDQVDSAKKKLPTEGDGTNINLEQTRSGKAPPQEQNDYQSVPPTPQSKIESKTPSIMQIVPGIAGGTKSSKDNDVENMKDQLVSKVLTDNTLLMDKLSKYLDRESRVIKCWKHLAYVLDVPAEERVQFDMYTEHSPTEDLFNFLADIWNPDLTVQELKVKLKKIHRNDLIEGLNREGFKDEMKVCDLISGQPKFIKLLAPKLDVESRTIGNWKSLATEFSIRKQKTEQFGLRGSGPTGALFSYMRTADRLRHLTMEELQKHFEGMERRDLVNLLTKQKKIEGSWFVKDVLVDGSELLAEIGERLNKEIAAIKNWRNLAYRLNIPHETYSTFDTSKGKAKSPTKMMFEWLAKSKPGLNIGDLLKGIKEIDRADVVEIVTQEAEAVLKKVKRDEDSSRQFNFVDGETQPTVSQVFHDLDQMHQDADKKSSKATDLYSALAQKAKDRGFAVSENVGKGDCMFYALSEQLELVKGIRCSAEELRKELVQYLKENPKLPNGTDLFNFIHGYESWPFYLEKMSQHGTWGDNVILQAAANKYNTPIRVVSSLQGHNDIIISPVPPACHSTDTLVVGHIHEEHYVSLPPIQVPEDLAFPRGNPHVIQGNGQDSQYFQSAQYGVPPFSAAYANKQGNQHHYPSQGYQQRHVPHLSQAYQRGQQGHYQLPGSHIQHQKERYQSQGFQQQRGLQQIHKQQQPWSKDVRRAMRVLDLPRKDIYSKICVKLNIRRDLNFDDFRMVAEELGMDRETTEYAGQQRNPTDFIFLEFYPNVTVGRLINILHKIERVDVAAVLENWIEQGST